jgi:hypothetical protein
VESRNAFGGCWFRHDEIRSLLRDRRVDFGDRFELWVWQNESRSKINRSDRTGGI